MKKVFLICNTILDDRDDKDDIPYVESLAASGDQIDQDISNSILVNLILK